jgi:beta-mannanase
MTSEIRIFCLDVNQQPGIKQREGEQARDMVQNATGATPFPLGVFVGNPNYYDSSEEASFETNFNAFSDLMKTKPQFLDQYSDQRLPVSGWVGQASWNAASMAQSPVLKGVTPVIGLPMTSTAPGSGSPDQFYKDFAAGKYDSVLKGMVQTWADHGFATQIWRPGWEMNIDTMPSYAGNDAATRADWVKAFQHISTVLHAAGKAEGVSVQVAWNPSVLNYSHAGNVIQTAYPGNQYVDIIAADVYGDVFPYGSPTHLYDWDKSGQVLNSSHPVYDSSVQQWASDPVNLQHYYTYPAANQWSLDGSVGHATTLQQLIDLAKSTGKPFAIAETGAGNTHDGARLTDNPTFVKWLADTLHQSGVHVSFVNIWDSNSVGQYHFTSSADHKPLEAAAWARYFGDPPTSTSPFTSKSAPVTSDSSHTPVVAVADTLPAAAPTPTSPPQTNVTDHSTDTNPDHGWWSEHRDSITNGGMTTPATHTSMSLAGQSSALLSQIEHFVAERGGLNAVTAPINAAEASHADGSTAAFLASHGFALLNQHLAGNAGRVEPGQIVSTGSNSATWAQDLILTRPQH